METDNTKLIPLNLINSWQIARGKWQISKDQRKFTYIGYPSDDDPNPDGLLLSDHQIADGIFETEVMVNEVSTGDTNAHLVIRYHDFEEYMFSGLGGWDCKYVIAQRAPGESALRRPGWAPVAQDAKIEDIIPKRWYKLKVDFSGPNIDLYVSNVRVLRYTSTQRYATFPIGNIGFRGVRKNRVHFRNPTATMRVRASDVRARLQNVDISFIKDGSLRAVAKRDLEQVMKLDADQVPKAVVVLLGSIVEGVLLDFLLGNEAEAKKCKSARKVSIFRWNMDTYIEVARELGGLKDTTYATSHTLRGYRNLIHPGKPEAQELAPWPSQAVASIDFFLSLMKDIKSFKS